MNTRRSFLQSSGAALTVGALPAVFGMRIAHGQAIPAGYPADYAETVKKARAEGRLVVYSNMSNPNWAPVAKAFNQRYPDIKVDMLDLGASESVNRYLAERSTGVASADLLVTANQAGWLELNRRGEILDHVSPEAAAWPAWSKPFKGLYTASTDPLFFAWNNTKVAEATRPKTFAQFAALAEANKATWTKRITTYDPTESIFGYTAHWHFVRHHGEAAGWKMLEQIGRVPPRFESGGGPQIEKVTSGEYLGAYFVSGIQVWPRLKDPVAARFLGWSFIGDGQLLMMRGMGVLKGAKNPNAAKLLLDFCLSAEGQQAFGLGGVTPARPDVLPSATVRHTYSSISQAVGEKNVVLIGYDEKQVTEHDAFVARFKKTLAG
jgi:iron(III) transport system substrate-binding protein